MAADMTKTAFSFERLQDQLSHYAWTQTLREAISQRGLKHLFSKDCCMEWDDITNATTQVRSRFLNIEATAEFKDWTWEPELVHAIGLLYDAVSRDIRASLVHMNAMTPHDLLHSINERFGIPIDQAHELVMCKLAVLRAHDFANLNVYFAAATKLRAQSGMISDEEFQKKLIGGLDTSYDVLIEHFLESKQPVTNDTLMNCILCWHAHDVLELDFDIKAYLHGLSSVRLLPFSDDPEDDEPVSELEEVEYYDIDPRHIPGFVSEDAPQPSHENVESW